MEFVLGLIKQHFGSILIAVLVGITWWRGGFGKLSGFIEKLETHYDRLRKTAEDYKVRQVAKTAYDWVEDEGKQWAKKTETKADDKVLDKLAKGLEMGLKLLKRAGLNGDGSEDELKALFGEFHTAEAKAKELAEKSPFGGKQGKK